MVTLVTMVIVWCNLTGQSLSRHLVKWQLLYFKFGYQISQFRLNFVQISYLRSFQISVHISYFYFELQHVSQLHNQQGQDAQVYTLKVHRCSKLIKYCILNFTKGIYDISGSDQPPQYKLEEITHTKHTSTLR